MQPEQQQRIMGYFIEEAKDHLNTIEQGLLNLQNTIEDSEMVNEVFRAAHSVKGGAAMLGISSVQKTAHRLEDCFKVLQQYPVKVDQKLESLFLRVFDILQELVEQLAEPFGFKDETASDIMSGVEQIFEELNNHLGQLVKGTAGDSASGVEEFEIARAKSKTLKPDRKALQETFQRDVLAQLREMLQLFKQPDSSFNRQQVQEICSHIESLGEQLNLSAWSGLLETAKIAIANPQNSYRTLAGIVIKEIKHAQELILAGREAEVVPSQQLKDLLPQTEAAELGTESEAAIAAALNISTRTDPNFTGMLQADNTSMPMLAPAIQPDSTEKSSADSNSDSYIQESTGAELSAQNFRDTEGGAISFPPLPRQKNSVKSTPARPGTDPNEPEAGMAELNSLADLFEGEAPDIEETWQQEEIISNGETEKATDALTSVNGDFENDFSDLLGEIDGQITDSTEVSEQDDFMLLFGDDISSEAAEPEKVRGNEEDYSISHLGLDFSPANDDFSELLFQADTPDLLRAEATQEDELTSLFSDSIEWEGGFEQLTLEGSLDFSIDASTTLDQELRDDDFLDFIKAEEVNKASQAETSTAEDLGISPGIEESLSDWFTGLDENDSLFREYQSDSSSSHLDNRENKKIESLADKPEALESWQLEQVETSEQYSKSSDSASDWQDLVFDEDQTVDIEEELKKNGLFKDEVALAEAATNLSDLFESSQVMPELPKLLEDLAIDDAVGIELINDELPSDELLEAELDAIATSDATLIDSTSSLTSPEAISGEEELGEAALELLPEETSQATLKVDENIEDLFEVETPEATETLDFGTDMLAPETSDGDGDIEPATAIATDAPATSRELEALVSLEAASSSDELFETEMPITTDDLEFDEEWDLKSTTSVTSESSPAPNVIDDEFGDLEKLLQQADQKMGGLPTAKPVAGQPRAKARPRQPVFEQTMRVSVKHLDNLSNLVGELVVNRNSLEQDQERLRQFLDNLLNQVQQLRDVGSRMQNLYERSLLENSLIASRHNYRNLSKSDAASPNNHPSGVEYDPLEMDRFTPVHLLSQEMIELIVKVRESASDIEFIVDETDQVARMLRQITTQLQEGLTRSRMVPFAQTADRLQRGVRDNAIKQGKQVELNIEGRETLIDKVILEHLTDPLTHMVNNALAHGVEKPEVRQAAGKPALGRITVRAFQQGNQTVISVSDDGAGIDAERVKAKALTMGLITPEEAKLMSRLDVYNLLFHPGFSIKDQADDLAGRGVGMDVVRTSLMDIRGTINTDSSLGQGTTFSIRLPLTLSIGKALSCISEKARIAFPMDGVEDMLDVPNASIQINAEGQRCIPWRDSLLPFQTLSELLTYNRQISRGTVYGGNREDDMISIVVLRSTGNFLAIEVDQVLGEHEIVIKQLEGPVPKPVGVAGATVLGDGRIMPIADVLELIDLSRGVIRKEGSGGSVWPGMQFPTEAAEVKTDPMVLIVDDSITVRELLSMTFNKAGYRVEQARDGQEAWDKLRSGLPCDIVFCDIEMPRMDGLDLLSRIQKDASLNYLPVAMLTSLGADRHRQMAADLGASGYFTKPYLEEALLDAAQRMMKGEVLLTSSSNA